MDDRQWCLDTAIAEVGRECDSADYMVRVSDHTLQADRPAAFVLPLVLNMEPDNPQVLAAVAQSHHPRIRPNQTLVSSGVSVVT